MGASLKRVSPRAERQTSSTLSPTGSAAHHHFASNPGILASVGVQAVAVQSSRPTSRSLPERLAHAIAAPFFEQTMSESATRSKGMVANRGADHLPSERV